MNNVVMNNTQTIGEKLQSLFNFTNADGEVITFFNGKVTLSQIVVFIIAVIAIVLLRNVLKGVVKTIVLIAIVCVALVHFGIASPTQIKDAGAKIKETGISTYEMMAKASENVKVENGNVKIRVQNEWFDLKDIETVISSGATYTITVNGKTLVIDDDKVIEVIKTLTDSGL